MVSMAWLLLQFPLDEALNAALGMNRHAITYFAIVLLVGGLASAAVFGRFHRVRSDLLAGRNVIAEWTVEPGLLRQFAATEALHDRGEKRGALIAILAFTAVIFVAVALFDVEAAPGMLTIGAVFAVVIVLAFLYGNRVHRAHLQPRSGRIIVGRDGLLANDVLHVWRLLLTRLAGATLEDGPPTVLTISYAVLGRAGPQLYSVGLPVPVEARDRAERAWRELSAAVR
jgi:hypothetical protein